MLECTVIERESGQWPLGLCDFYHNYLISNDCIRRSGKISICNTLLKQFFILTAT